MVQKIVGFLILKKRKSCRLISTKAKVMTKFIFSLIWISLIAGSVEASAQEKTSSYHVHININRDSSIDVLESIEYDFGTALKKGIYRTIPIIYKRNEKKYLLNIADIEAFDDEGKDQLFDILKGEKEIRVDLGSDVKKFTGTKTFHLSYRVQAALVHNDKTDILHWNAIGTKWDVPINKSRVSIELPSPVKKEELEKWCYVGPPGSQLLSSKAEYKYDSTNEDRVSSILFGHDYTLNPGEGVTVELSWPKGLVSEAQKKEIPSLPRLFWLFMGAITLIPLYGLYRVFRSGEDPTAEETVSIKTDVPEGLIPCEAGIVLKRNFTNKCLVAQLLSLAIRGYIKIIEGKKGLFFLNSTSFLLLRLKESNDLPPTEKVIMDKIFDARFSLSHGEALDYFKKKPDKLNDDLIKAIAITSPIKFKRSRSRFIKYFKEITKKSQKELFKKGYFTKPFQDSRFSGAFTVFLYVLAAAVAAALLMLAAAFLYSYAAVQMAITLVASRALIYIIILSFITYSLVMRRLPPRSKKGAQLRRHLLGLKRYLNASNNFQMENHIDPGVNLDYFEKLLPYAIALGKENKWVKCLPDQTYNPMWYRGYRRRFVNTKILDKMISNISSSSGAAGGGGAGGVGGGAGGGGWRFPIDNYFLISKPLIFFNKKFFLSYFAQYLHCYQMSHRTLNNTAVCDISKLKKSKKGVRL